MLNYIQPFFMQGVTIKSIIIFVLLAIFAFIAGSFVTNGFSEALIPTVMIVSAFGLIALGKNSWWLLILLPPIFSVLPIYLVRAYPIAYACAGLILLYWLYLSVVGYTRFTWRGVRWLDIVTFLLFVYTLYTWILHPVAFKFLVSYTDEGDMTYGGDVYLWCLGAIVFYIAMSVIPMKLKVVVELLKWSFVLCLCVTSVVMIKQLIFPSELPMSAIEELDKTGESTRIRHPAFASTGMYLFKFFIAKYSLLGVLLSPIKILVVLFGCLMFMLSGHRLYFVQCFFFVLCVCGLYRQFLFCVILILSVWGGLVMFSQMHLLERLPYAYQRSLASIPGVTVSKNAEVGAQGSLEWRYEMWEWGMNPRAGFIKDYVWGDGYKVYVSDSKRREYLISVKKEDYHSQAYFAEIGHWHAGWLNVIYRVGFVGLFILTVYFFVLMMVAIRGTVAVKTVEGKEFIYMILLALPGSVIIFYWADGTWEGLFRGILYNSAIAKVVYALARDEGLMKPMLQRKSYVPLMVEANESQSKLRVLQ